MYMTNIKNRYVVFSGVVSCDLIALFYVFERVVIVMTNIEIMI